MKPMIAGVRLSAYKIPEELEIGIRFSFTRRVCEDYLIPSDEDPFISTEGLYPCAVVPEYLNGKLMIVAFDTKNLGMVLDDGNQFSISHMGFEQAVKKRHLIPSKSRTYYEKEKYYCSDGSPEDFYTTLIFPKKIIGEVVTIIPNKDR